MGTPCRNASLAALALLALVAAPAAAQESRQDFGQGSGQDVRRLAEQDSQPDGERGCNRNAMIVFDASGSMAGSTTEDIFSQTTRLGEVRAALQEVLPDITQFRKVGLITYGPGPERQCNVQLDFPPIANATKPILSAVDKLNAAGKTPLAQAVQKAADVLHYRTTPGTVVLLTDGEDTCGGTPCELGKKLALGKVTVHVIAYQMKGVEWTGVQSILDVQCLAHATGGEYIKAETREDLIKAFQKTLGCPMVSSVENPLR